MKNVTVYMGPMCAFCDAAKRLLTKKNIPYKEINIAINQKRKAFKKYMGPELHLKNTPDLHFFHDESLLYGNKINKLIHDIDIKNTDESDSEHT